MKTLTDTCLHAYMSVCIFGNHLYENTFSRFSRSPLCLILVVAFRRETIVTKFLNGELLNATANLEELPVLLPVLFTCCYTYNHMQILQERFLPVFQKSNKFQKTTMKDFEKALESILTDAMYHFKRYIFTEHR